MESYLHPYYSVYHFRLAYSGVIKPLPDKSQWPHVDLGFKVLPPLSKREVGRQRKNRYPSCLEDKGNKPKGKGAWQVQCKNCFQFGHRTTSPKCPLNGTRKRKSRAKKGKAGRPPGTSKEGASTSKRQRVEEQESSFSTTQEGATVSTTQEGATVPTESLQVMSTEGVTTCSIPKS